MQGKFSKAIELYERGLPVLQKQVNDDNPIIASFLNRLGTMYLKQGNFDKAYELFGSLSEKHLYFAFSSLLLGDIYVTIGNYSKGIKFLEKSLSIFKEISKLHVGFALNFFCLGRVYLCQQKIPKALNYFKESSSIYKKIFPDNNNIYISDCFMFMGKACCEQGKFDKALKFSENNNN